MTGIIILSTIRYAAVLTARVWGEHDEGMVVTEDIFERGLCLPSDIFRWLFILCWGDLHTIGFCRNLR